jgi:hypothetical protein
MIPFGQLISFGTIILNGDGAISRVKSAWPLEFAAEYDTSLITVGRPYPFDVQGLSAAPYKSTPTLCYEYIIVSDPGHAEEQAFRDLRTKWNQIYTALQGTYSWNGTAGVSGQKGTLVVADEDPTVSTLYSATARALAPAPFKLQKGHPYALSVELKFALLSEFEASS